jgi:hypothetical protein
MQLYSPQNLTQGSNPDRKVRKPTTNRLSYGTAYSHLLCDSCPLSLLFAFWLHLITCISRKLFPTSSRNLNLDLRTFVLNSGCIKISLSQRADCEQITLNDDYTMRRLQKEWDAKIVPHKDRYCLVTAWARNLHRPTLVELLSYHQFIICGIGCNTEDLPSADRAQACHNFTAIFWITALVCPWVICASTGLQRSACVVFW